MFFKAMEISRPRLLPLILATISFMSVGIRESTALPTVTAGPVVNPENGHSYYLLTADTWTNSEAEAIALGGHLASINDQDEQNWVYTQFPLPSASFVWLGARDQRIPSWIWVDSSAFTYTNWGSFPGGSEPDGNPAVAESYLAMFTPDQSRAGTWADLYDTDGGPTTFGLVEVVPEPAGLGMLGFGALCLWVNRRTRRSVGRREL